MSMTRAEDTKHPRGVPELIHAEHTPSLAK